ncbi:MAG: glycosyltransferase family 4 protein [Candidatus Wildermuthbacteria bacterium]|nr:glycosyltransferase family 4 protein [Candidatus Wildermuthbacteria bacterium]
MEKSSLKKVKICHVASADITLKFLLLPQMKYLKQLGYDVFAVSASGKWIPEIQAAGISVYTPQITRRMFTPFADLVALVHLISFFRKERFDIVHTHTLKASFLGQIAAFLAGVPIRIYTNHGLDFANPSLALWNRALFILIDKIIAYLVHVAFFVNREDMKIAKKEGVYSFEKMRYYGGPVNLERFNPDRFPQEFIQKKKQELGIPLNRKVVGIVGRLVRDKGYFELFEAFKKVLLHFPGAVLLIIGSLEPEKEDRFTMDVLPFFGIEKNTIYLGERSDMEEVYPLMDIFVLPTYREGLGVSILEASAMKLPVVATDIRGCRGSVDKGVTGILVPPKNSEKVAEAVLSLLQNHARAKEMGEAGRKKIEREFDEKVVFERVQKEYARLLELKGNF